MPRYPDLDAGEVASRYLAGESIRQLCKAYGVSNHVITKRLRDRRVAMRSNSESHKGRAMLLDLASITPRYVAGESIHMLAGELGISQSYLARRLKESGVKTRNRSEARLSWFGHEVPEESDVLRRFALGESVSAIARSHGVSWQVVNGILRRAGVENRSMSETMRSRYASMSPAQRSAVTSSACTHLRTVRRSDELYRRVARGREVNQSQIRSDESDLAALLELEGLKCKHQKAFDRYNVDLTIETTRIVVEVYRGYRFLNPNRNVSHRDRTSIINAAGYAFVGVVLTASTPLAQEAARYVATLSSRIAGGDRSDTAEHIIRGDGLRMDVSEYPGGLKFF